jgi:hypothetical protein
LNLLFLSNWERTETWIAAGRELERRGHGAYFVVTRDEYRRKALAAGFAPERILWLTRQGAEAADIGGSLEALAALEAATGLRIADVILMDRFLRSERQDWALRYAAHVHAALAAFIDENGIDLAVGQPDNVPDLLAEALMKARGGRYAAPFEFRMPTRRFMLWDSRIEARPHITGAATPADVTEAELEEARALRDRVTRGTKMRQVEARTAPPAIGAGFVKRLARGFLHRALIVSRHDVYMYTLRSALFDLRYHMTPINHRRLARVWDRLFEQPREGERFVFYALNYEPEHTLDVEAPHFTSTLETVRNIARSLPLGVRLYVKEHPTGLGLRGPAALERIKRLPGVRLIDPWVDSHALIKAAELTVSLSGTVSLEAAMYGRQTAILSDIFIAGFSTCRRLNAPWEVGAALAAAPLEHRPDDDMRRLAWLISNSHPGTVIEPLVDPASLEAENVSLIADAIEKVAVQASASRTPTTRRSPA